MVTMSSLENILPMGTTSDYLAISESSVAVDRRLAVGGGEDGSIGVHRTLSKSVNQTQKMQSDVHLDSTCYKADRHLVGVIGAQNESSLFSSSLSELVDQQLRLSGSKFLSRQSSTITSQKDEVEPFKSLEETEGHAINNPLPDDEELFSGMVDEMECMGHASMTDDLDDFDLFTCSGGIELEADDELPAGQRNVGNPWGHQPKQHSAVHLVDHAKRIHSTQRLPNGSVFGDASAHESSHIYNVLRSPVRLPSVSSEFGRSEAGQSFPQVQLDNRGIPSFHPHSPQLQLHSVANVIPQNSLDSLTGIADDIGLKVPEKVNLDIHHLGLNGHAMELNEGVFGYSPNGIHMHQSVASKSNSYQNYQLRSLLMPNSPSLLNNNHAHHLGRLAGSPGAPHLMMNMVSPVHHLHVGSAPVVKASWDRQKIFAGESHEAAGYQMGCLRSVGLPGFPASNPREISPHGSFPRFHGTCTEMSKSPGLHSPQQMSRMFHERNTMNSLPTSFGSPIERVRSRRNENNMSHADRKHYELNIDRILRGEDSRTTLMIKNIPNKYTSKMLLATIDEQHRGKYDFIYLPIDFKNKCNMGYAFINMVDPLHIVAFHQTFEGRKWEKFNSEKVASLAYARIQGKAALIAHFQNSSLMNEDKRCRPILFHTDGPNAGDQEPFPMGTNFRPKQGKLQVGADEDE